MNNSKIALDNVSLEMESPIDTTPILRDKVMRLERIIEAFDRISESNYWKVLDEEIFSGILESLSRRMRNEKDRDELLRLQGQIVWANKFCNFRSLADGYKRELISISNTLNGKE